MDRCRRFRRTTQPVGGSPCIPTPATTTPQSLMHDVLAVLGKSPAFCAAWRTTTFRCDISVYDVAPGEAPPRRLNADDQADQDHQRFGRPQGRALTSRRASATLCARTAYGGHRIAKVIFGGGQA